MLIFLCLCTFRIIFFDPRLLTYIFFDILQVIYSYLNLLLQITFRQICWGKYLASNFLKNLNFEESFKDITNAIYCLSKSFLEINFYYWNRSLSWERYEWRNYPQYCYYFDFIHMILFELGLFWSLRQLIRKFIF